MSYTGFLRIPVKKIAQYAITAGVVISFFTGFVQAPQLSLVNAQEGAALKQQEREELEKQLKEYEQQIEETQRTIDEYRKKGNSLKGEISSLNAQIQKLNLQIKTVNLNLSKLNQDISETQSQINRTENKIDQHRDAIGESLQTIYESSNENLLTILLSNSEFSDFFGKLNDLQLVQENLRVSLQNITKLRQELLDQKEELSLEKQDAENLRAIQDSQKKGIQSTQSQKNSLLKVTQGKESEYQKLLAQKQAEASKIRTRLFELLGGGSLSFEQALNYARIAERATGVRAAFILGILDRESRFGANTGKCIYNAINASSGKTNMNPKEIPVFEEITRELGIDPTSQFAKISCPNADGTYGGAMGPAQFIPSTWKAYKSRIASLTGHNPPNPWL
jgi:peptidoglycan hydrolase CwlO-like protein